jgi:hypothetical protein
MRKARLSIMVGGILAIGCAVVWTILSTEPSYEGRRLSSWLRDLGDSDARASTQEHAAEAIRAIGTKGIPHLVRMVLNTPDSPYCFRVRVGEVLERQSLVRLPFARRWADWTRCDAVQALGVLRDEAESAIGPLSYALTNRPAPGRTGIALSSIGPRAVPALIAALHSTNASTRAAAVQAFYDLGSDGKEAFPELAELYDRESDPWFFYTGRLTNAMYRIDPVAAAALLHSGPRAVTAGRRNPKG